MSVLVFTNPGLIDPVSMLTFGISAKTSDTAIGMFGTGFKYAIAVLLRSGFSVNVYSGTKTYLFKTQNTIVRGKDFDLVHMNDQPAGFTTELGKFWEPWMAIRELACNALDEQGSWRITHDAAHCHSDTTIVVSGTGVEELHREAKEIFLTSKPMIEHTGYAEIHPGKSNWIYYRGIRAMKLSKPSQYTYNITQTMTLTEDRTLKYAWDCNSAILKTAVASENKDLVRLMITSADVWAESEFSWHGAPITDWLKNLVSELVGAFKPVPKVLRDACNESIIKTLSAQRPAKLDALDQKRLDKAVKFCKDVGIQVDEYPIVVSNHLGQGTLGRAVDSKIYVSTLVFQQGTKMLAGTLIEEYYHLKHDVADCTREMQNLFVDTIVSLGERVTGDVL